MRDLLRISVVTPSYNQGQFLERTIVSVLNQNYPNLEYIIIDGGSTDGSVEIIKKYERYIAYWVSEPDDGQSHALVKGFDRATGEILAWLNSDDMYLSGALFTAARMFRGHPEAAVVYGDYIRVDTDDRCIALKRMPSFEHKICLYADIIVIQPASFFSRKAFFEAGGIDTSFNYTMDYDLISRLAKCGEVLHINKYLAAFRFYSASKTGAEGYRFPAESRRARLKNLGYEPFPGELFVLYWYHTARLALRMLKEGCFASRLGKDGDGYELNGVYTPRICDTVDGV